MRRTSFQLTTGRNCTGARIKWQVTEDVKKEKGGDPKMVSRFILELSYSHMQLNGMAQCLAQQALSRLRTRPGEDGGPTEGGPIYREGKRNPLCKREKEGKVETGQHQDWENGARARRLHSDSRSLFSSTILNLSPSLLGKPSFGLDCVLRISFLMWLLVKSKSFVPFPL